MITYTTTTVPSSNSLIDIDVLVDGKPINKYKHEGDTYVEGRRNSSYQIKIYNKSYGRIKVVPSVDGLSAIDGEPSSEKSPGYIIAGRQSIVIDGWRTSNDAVAKFMFGDKSNSYSAKVGEGIMNTGVIGVMVFKEVDPIRYSDIIWKSQTVTPHWDDYNQALRGPVWSTTGTYGHTSLSVSASATNNMGTGFGQEVASHVKEASFNAEEYFSELATIYYDDRKGLEARGIVINPRKMKPNPFPASQYCKRV